MDIVNVDEQGKTLESVDWSAWTRERVEEVCDDDGNVVKLISHCLPIPQTEIDEATLAELERKLANTDYISAKLSDALLGCSSITSIITTLKEFNDEYAEVVKQRQEWRDEINRIRNGETTDQE